MNGSELEKWCVKQAEKAGYLTYKFDRLGGKKGWPDRGLWGPKGRHYLVEFKRPGEKPSPLQKHIHACFLSSGHTVHVMRSKKGFLGLLGLAG